MARGRRSKQGRPAKRSKTVKGGRGEAVARPPKADASGYRLQDEALERSLLTGEHGNVLEAYFGEDGYTELRDLARQASARSVRGGPRVLILPGIMGSKLGVKGRILDDVLWLDPVDIAAGHLTELSLAHGPTKHVALGVILFAYLKLKLRLKLNGFDADFHPFDWRQSLDSLGDELAQRLKSEPAAQIQLVAHSMGGLVARAALERRAPKVQRLVMLGTPNFGSFAPVQAIRGVYSVVRNVAAVDLVHDATALSEQVFNFLPGLYQMLPQPAKFNQVNLVDPASWPQSRPQPNPQLLEEINRVGDMLADADQRFFLIAGVNRETVTGLQVDNGEFVYEQSLEGDGTVPLAFAELPGAQTCYVEESHGSLPNNGLVERAVIDLLRSGATSVLPNHWAPTRRGPVRCVRESDLPLPAFEGRRGAQLTPSEIRHLLDGLVSPEASDSGSRAAATAVPAAVGEVAGVASFDGIVVGRRRAHRIDVHLACGNIANVDASAYVLGAFRDVAPSGAANDVDARLDGAISELSTRRMFDLSTGEVFIVPTGRHPLRADLILFVGLGPFDKFDDGVQGLAAENVIRTFIQTNVPDFATVLLGAGSGRDVAATLTNLLSGFFRGLRDADRQHRVRSITLCEMDPSVYTVIKRELFRLAATPLFEGVEVTLDEIPLPPSLPAAAPARRVAVGPEPAYLIVRQERAGRLLRYDSSVLTAGAKAAVVSGTKDVPKTDLERHLDGLEEPSFSFGSLHDFGQRLAGLVLPEDVSAVLSTMQNRHLVVVHDSGASRIPWETTALKDWFPAASAGLSRRYMAENLSVAKWLEQRPHDNVLNVLLVVDPTETLDGAKEEGKRVRDLFAALPSVRLTEFWGADGTKEVLLPEFRSGKYDVLHYAGHAFFDPLHPARSGILCRDRVTLSGADLAGVARLPALVFFNACEAARVRRGAERKDKKLTVAKRIERNIGLAEAFLRGGVANYLGTYWPVGDEAAKTFARTFYGALLGGKSVGAALGSARAAVFELRSVDWADYVHYGSYGFTLREV
jgi:pimeloyl-ACP methyl ester carboxylesterase